MGKFCKAVQKGAIASPDLRRFTSEVWDAEYARLGEDEADRSLHAVGHLVSAKLTTIRASLKVANSKTLNATTKLRAFAAIANHNTSALSQKVADTVTKAVDGKEMVQATDLAGLKIRLAIGAEFLPDEIVQTMVDGSQLAFSEALRGEQAVTGNPRFGEVDWDDALLDFNLGNLYTHIQDIWEDCLWNDYRLGGLGDSYLFAPSNPDWPRTLAASRVRHNSLVMQFFDIAKAHCARMSPRELNERIGLRDIKGIIKQGRKQVFQLSAMGAPTVETIHLFVARVYASETYYKGLLNEPQQKLEGASLNGLVGAWAIVARIAEMMRGNIEKDSTVSDAEPEAWLPKYSPILQRDALYRAVANAVGLGYSQAVAIVEFLTFRGNRGQELWAQPLIPISDISVTPMFAATKYANLHRLIDVWLRQLDVDLGLRGPAFEDHVRTELSARVKSSTLQGSAWVLPTALKFRPEEDREEEIDVVLVIGSLVIIGEAKCMLHPAEAKQNADHRKKVTEAVAQVQRKALSVQHNRGTFISQLKNEGIDLVEDFEILPAVILNGAIHAGVSVDRVAVVDMHIFEVFFSGELVEFGMRTTNGDIKGLKTRPLYKDVEDAGKQAAGYFLAPHQMEPYSAGVYERVIPIASVDGSDWSGAYLAFDCRPVVPHLEDS